MTKLLLRLTGIKSLESNDLRMELITKESFATRCSLRPFANFWIEHSKGQNGFLFECKMFLFFISYHFI